MIYKIHKPFQHHWRLLTDNNYLEEEMRNIIKVILSLSLLFLLGSCEKKEEKTIGSMTQLRASISKGNSSSIYHITHDLGHFQEQNIEIVTQEFQSGKAALLDLINGNADMATATEFAYVSQSFDHKDLKILGCIATFRNKHFIFKPNKRIDSPLDLKGKKIGITRKSGSEYFLGTFLTKHQISLPEVDIIDLKPKQIVEELIADNIHIALIWEPYVFEIKALMEGNITTWPAQEEQENYTLLIVKEEWLQANKNIVLRFLRAIEKTDRYIMTNPEVINDFLEHKFLYEKSYIKSILPDHRFGLTLPEELIGAMTLEAKWRVDSGLSKGPDIPDYNQVIYDSGIKEAKK